VVWHFEIRVFFYKINFHLKFMQSLYTSIFNGLDRLRYLIGRYPATPTVDEAPATPHATEVAAPHTLTLVTPSKADVSPSEPLEIKESDLGEGFLQFITIKSPVSTSIGLHEASISGRSAPSIGRSQGHHVTAYALITKCITDPLANFPTEPTEVSKVREKLLSIMATLISISDNILEDKDSADLAGGRGGRPMKDPADQMLTDINDCLRTYLLWRDIFIKNTKRSDDDVDFIYSLIPEKSRTASADSAIKRLGDDIKKSSNLIKIYHNKDLLKAISTIFIHYFNRIEDISFPAKGSPEPLGDEGSTVKKALKDLSEIKTTNADFQDLDPKNVVKLAKDLFFYPKVPDKDLIDPASTAEWRGTDASLYAGTMPRNNDKRILAKVIARHLLIFKTAFLSGVSERFINVFNNLFIGSVAEEWGIAKEDDYHDTVTMNKSLKRTRTTRGSGEQTGGASLKKLRTASASSDHEASTGQPTKPKFSIEDLNVLVKANLANFKKIKSKVDEEARIVIEATPIRMHEDAGAVNLRASGGIPNLATGPKELFPETPAPSIQQRSEVNSSDVLRRSARHKQP
jgi:hypothetical protein